ncbi:MAG: CopG family antitoxin [Chlorobiaceae bacterium]
MKNKRIPIPEFRSEAEEQAFWSAQDSTDYVDWQKAETVLGRYCKPDDGCEL